jgi:uncharacterized protein involved in outer membrane biogenesis
MSRRQRTLAKRILLVLSAVIALPLLAGLLAIVLINPNDYKPQVVAALQSATGRKVSIGGAISVGFGFSPTVTLRDVHLANPPGFSRDDMAIVGSLETEVSLTSLVFGKIHISQLDISDADVQIETNPLGQTNTQFGPAKPGNAGANPAANAAAKPSANPMDQLQIDEIGIFGGRFATRDDVKGTRHELVINRTVLRTIGADQTLSVAGDIAYDRTPLAFSLETGALGRLFGQDVGPQDWPVRARGQSGNSQFSVQGTLRDPLAGRGYRISVEAAVDDLSRLSPLLSAALPPVHDLRLSVEIRDQDGVPQFSSLLVRSGRSDLTAYADGLSLDHLVLSAPSMDQPMHGELVGQFGNQPLQASLDIGAPQSLVTAALLGASKVSGADQRLPMAINAQIAGAKFEVKGQLAQPTALAGLDARVDVQIPDLTAFSALAGRKLPALSNLAFNVQVTDRAGGLAQGVTLHNIAFSGSPGDVAGDLDIALKPRLALVGNVSGKRLDLDALQLASDKASAASNAQPPAPQRQTVATRFVIPDTVIDFSPLTSLDADLTLAMGDVRSGGVDYRDIAGHAVLSNGKLVIDPFAATLPGGKLELKLSLDSLALPPAMGVVLSAPGLALKPLLTAFHQPDDVTGTVEIGADLTAAGRTPRAIAASLSGKLGVAMVDGELDNRLLGGPLNEVLRAARLPSDVLVGGSGGNRTRLRCVALRMDAVRGLANLSTLVLQTSAAQLQGSGMINLADETLALRLRPALRTGGPVVVIPVRASGTLAAPVVTLDASGAAQGVVSSVTGGLSGLVRNPIGTAGSALSDNDPCGPGLAAARAAQPATK